MVCIFIVGKLLSFNVLLSSSSYVPGFPVFTKCACNMQVKILACVLLSTVFVICVCFGCCYLSYCFAICYVLFFFSFNLLSLFAGHFIDIIPCSPEQLIHFFVVVFNSL